MNNLLRLIVVCGLAVFAVLIIALGMARNTGALLAPVHLLLLVILVVGYLFPTAVAYYRNCESVVWITLLNVFLGWTLFGWVLAVGWAASGKTRPLGPAIATPSGPALQGH
jgi:hypothetical protein